MILFKVKIVCLELCMVLKKIISGVDFIVEINIIY